VRGETVTSEIMKDRKLLQVLNIIWVLSI